MSADGGAFILVSTPKPVDGPYSVLYHVPMTNHPTIRPGSLLDRAVSAPTPVRQPRRKSQPRIVRLPAPVLCPHPGGKRTIGFGADGGRVDRCTRCVVVRDRTMRHEEAWIADPTLEELRKQIARGTQFVAPFKPKYKNATDADPADLED